VLFHHLPGQPPVGDDPVEVVHHLCLGHDRQPAKIGQLEAAGVDVAQAFGVEGRAFDGPGEQGPEPVTLELGELLGRPAEALDVTGQLAAEGGGHASS